MTYRQLKEQLSQLEDHELDQDVRYSYDDNYSLNKVCKIRRLKSLGEITENFHGIKIGQLYLD